MKVDDIAKDARKINQTRVYLMNAEETLRFLNEKTGIEFTQENRQYYDGKTKRIGFRLSDHSNEIKESTYYEKLNVSISRDEMTLFKQIYIKRISEYNRKYHELKQDFKSKYGFHYNE